MNIFTFIATIGAMGALLTFICGVKSMIRHSDFGPPSSAQWLTWHFLFEVTTFVTILTAPRARLY